MFRPLVRVVLFLSLLALALTVFAQEKLTKVEIGKRGKAATAFIHVARKQSGTAFCVHPSGLFVTNEHVIRGVQKEELTLVLNPSLESQRALKARVVRSDSKLDLALLRVEGVKDLPSLPLGSIKDVAELSDVVACGFPLGFALSPDMKDYPAISVNAGTVTALRYKKRELQYIQIDVSVTFGNSGGPVLDENGKVIGVVSSGLIGIGKGINRAIPVSHVEDFLKKPEIAFTPPALSRKSLTKPAEFKASIVSFLPNAPEPALKLVLQAEDDKAREFPMKKQGAFWIATAPPLAKTAVPSVEIAVQLGRASAAGSTEDVVFKVAGKPMRLSGVRRITFKDKPEVLLADGHTTMAGEITGLGNVEIDLAGQKVKIDLAKATQATVQAAPEITSVTASIRAIVEDKEVARADSLMIVRDALARRPADPSSVAIHPPSLEGEKVVKQLPEVFGDVRVGGCGRYLIFQLPKLKKLAVFDVNEARITKYIPLTEDNITFTAGLDSIVIGLKKAGKLERWSLTTFELEKSGYPPFKDEIKQVIMGHGSNGPLVVNGLLVDLESFQYYPVGDAQASAPLSIGTDRAPSGDGTVYGAWQTNFSPATSISYVLEGGGIKRYDNGDLRHVIPGPDGRTLFTGKGIVSQTLQRGDPDDEGYGYCLPAMRGDYFLSISAAGPGHGGGFSIYLRGLKRPIAKLDNANHGLTFNGWDREQWGPWRRVFFIPDAKVIAVLPASNDQVVLHKFDAEAALEKSGENYLLVTSRPPREVKAGKEFTYAIKVKSKQGGVTYKLDSGPKGMSVSAEGVVMWKAPAGTPPGDQEVILTVRDKAGQEVFHTFTLKVVK